MDKTAYQSELFSNRLKRKYKELRKTMRKNRVLCYRLYDRDMPEVPISLDLYEFLPGEIDTQIEAARFIAEQNARISANDPAVENDIKERTYAVLYLYERPYEKSDEEEAVWLDAMTDAAAQVIGIKEEHVVKKMRGRKSHKGSQYEKNVIKDPRVKPEDDKTSVTEDDKASVTEDDKTSVIVGLDPTIYASPITGLTLEQGQLFRLDLTSYLDTGLFFDHRTLRSTVRDTCSKKRVLNLFCYTGSFSVYAAQGNARYVESVDLSNTYLAWTKDNMKLNGFDDRARYVYTRADCMRFLQEKAVAAKAGELEPAQLYDLIILDPPTFSNSKATTDVLDINRDWPQLVKDCLNILAPGGTLYFSTNSERIKFDISKLPPKTITGLEFSCEEITDQSIPLDYTGKKPHRLWKFDLKK